MAGKRTGISECTVSRWASNKALPNLSSLHVSAKLLKVDVSDITEPNIVIIYGR